MIKTSLNAQNCYNLHTSPIIKIKIKFNQVGFVNNNPKGVPHEIGSENTNEIKLKEVGFVNNNPKGVPHEIGSENMNKIK